MLGVCAAGPLGMGGDPPGGDPPGGDPPGGDPPGGDPSTPSGPDDPYAPERDAWVALTSIDGLGPVAFASLLARYGSGRAILAEAARPGAVERLMATPALERPSARALRRPVPRSLAKAIADAVQDGPRIVARTRLLGVRAVTMEEPAYPRRLAQVAMPPHVLFVTGDLAALARRHAVAVVGTRRATTAGRTTAGRIATALTAAGATVVSGLAYGIDGAAHEATVRAGGTTVAVIGSSHAAVSPRAHSRLAESIVRAGGAVVSELAPGVEPTRGTFPRRNRIISGLSDATVVVEAPASSGALITASWALEQGRGCFIVPGGIGEPAAAGCLAFLREFPDVARIVTGVPQLVADLGLVAGDGVGADDGQRDLAALVTLASLGDLGVTESRLARELIAGRVTVDELVAATDLPVATVLAALVLLERRGLAAGVHGRYRPAGALLRVPG